ncbi:MAG: Smr/MutS family protein [Alphaproteobacteria bacterium]|nr:Smr/MutS family protein [Alphaproteobacteria bacterium]
MPENPPKSKNKKEDGTKSPNVLKGEIQDLELWQSFCKDISPLSNPKPIVTAASPEAPALTDKKTRIKYRRTFEDFGTNLSPALHIPSEDTSSSQSSRQIDKKLKERFEKGDLVIDGRIDLHGLSEALAQRQFSQFIAAHIHSGARCLLVITGKGRDPLTGQAGGILQRSLPRWIDLPAFAPHILSCKTAPRHLGGAGAFLILLRRKKN